MKRIALSRWLDQFDPRPSVDTVRAQALPDDCTTSHHPAPRGRAAALIDGPRERWARMRWSDNWARGNPAFVACCQECQHRWQAVVISIPMCPRCSSQYVGVELSATDQMRAQHATGIG